MLLLVQCSMVKCLNATCTGVCDVMVMADTVTGVGEIKSDVEVRLQATMLKIHAKFGVWPVGESKFCQGSWF